MRSCPVCGVPLIEITREGQVLDRCTRCGGLYFDRGELAQVVDLWRILRSVRLDEIELATVPVEEVERDLHCPADGSLMEPRDIGNLVIDVCPTCEGIWLDKGELVGLQLAERNLRENLTLYIRLGG